MNRSLIIADRLMYVALLAMIFFLPFSFVFIETCQVIMIVAWACKRFLLYKTPGLSNDRSSGFNFFSSSIGWSLLAIALLIVLTIPCSHYPALSLKKLFTRFGQQIFLMYLITEIVNSRKRLYSVFLVLLFTLFFVIVDVMVQYAYGKSLVFQSPLIFGRVSGPMKHPNDLGTLLVTVLPLALTLIFTAPRCVALLSGSSKPMGRGMNWAVVASVSVLSMLLFETLGLTASRGAWLAFMLSIVALGFLLKRLKLTVLIIFIIVVFSWVFGVHCLSTRMDMYDIKLKQGPVIAPSLANPCGLPSGYHALAIFSDPSDRGVYWNTAMEVIKLYPWFGCGYNAYVQTLKDLYVGHEEDPHNALLHITAELGMVGLILYGWFFTALFLKIKNILHDISADRDLYWLGCGVSSGILAWMMHSLMDTAWASLQLSLLWWLFVGIILSMGLIIPKGRLSNKEIKESAQPNQ